MEGVPTRILGRATLRYSDCSGSEKVGARTGMH